MSCFCGGISFPLISLFSNNSSVNLLLQHLGTIQAPSLKIPNSEASCFCPQRGSQQGGWQCFTFNIKRCHEVSLKWLFLIASVSLFWGFFLLSITCCWFILIINNAASFLPSQHTLKWRQSALQIPTMSKFTSRSTLKPNEKTTGSI